MLLPSTLMLLEMRSRQHRAFRFRTRVRRHDVRRRRRIRNHRQGAAGRGRPAARPREGGVNFIDTADVYSEGFSERSTGQALKNVGVKREEVVPATKVFGNMGQGRTRRGHRAAISWTAPKLSSNCPSLFVPKKHARHARLVQQPGDGELRDRRPLFGGEVFEHVDDGVGALRVDRRELEVGAAALCVVRPPAAELAAQQTARERAPDEQPEPLAFGHQDEFAFGVAPRRV